MQKLNIFSQVYKSTAIDAVNIEEIENVNIFSGSLNNK